MRNFLALLIAGLLFTACGSDKVAIPDDVIGRKEMVPLLTDMQLVEGAFHKRVVKGKNARNETIAHYANVFQTHGITQEQFNHSFAWYEEHPEILEDIYADVMEELSKLQAELKAAEPAEPAKAEEPSEE